MGQAEIRIRYRGRGSLEQFGVGPPKPEILRLSHVYGVEEELRERPGWFVHKTTIERDKLTLVVELIPLNE